MTEISKPRIIALAISVGLGKFQTNDFVALKACFPSYQGESTVFDNGNFLS